MKHKSTSLKSVTRLSQLPSLLRTLLKDESIGGKLILIAALLSLIVINSPLADIYTNFWQTKLSIGLGSWSLSLDLRHWVNEALMAFFFLVVGLEIKRELVTGELKNPKVAALPIGAAIGGMIVPALVYLFFNTQAETIRGWGIPIATDIAFAVAVLSLLGHRVPLALKLFLLTLAIADDIGAIFIIALFYAEIIHYGYLFGSFALLAAMWLFRKRLGKRMFVFVTAGIVLWTTTHLSGIHASIVGAGLGLLAPVGNDPVERSLGTKLEKMFIPFSTLFVVPIFAFANAGVILSHEALTSGYSVMAGIIFGLVLGKTIGITLASWFMVKFKLAKLPEGVNWTHIIGVGFIAGIGFTVSIFITELAFLDNTQLIDASKISIFIASGLSALLGCITLVFASRNRKLTS